MVNIEERYSFNIKEKGFQQTFYLSIDEAGNPIKLGDGSFGIVFKASDATGKDYAVKLLYNTQTSSRIKCPFLKPELIEDFCQTFKIPPDNLVLQKIASLNKKSERLGIFAVNLKLLKLPDEQFQFLLDKIHFESESIAYKRYLYEMESARKIRDEQENPSTGIIENIGGTDKFRCSKAYKTLKNVFELDQIDLSDFAIVMPLYKCTLKTLLEDGYKKYSVRISVGNELSRNDNFPVSTLQQITQLELSSEAELKKIIDDVEEFTDEQKRDLKKYIIELSGYELLKSMKYDKRISTILPYLMDICQGLKALHLAKMYHYDLKPANIFVRQEGAEVRSVIGDLGFLMVPEMMDSGISNIKEILPLGTRHYRSPEQKDYFDLCDVEIRYIEEDDSVILVIKDPKFKDSIIEVGDFLNFSKDSSREKYYISDIDKNQSSTIIKLGVEFQKLKARLKPDKCTQVIFYKEQAVRTDLFGFGAILFDLLTCGKSPERFYDNIRAYDNENNDVIKMMELYRQVSMFQAHEPGLFHVFAPFKHEKDPEYAPPEIVELILKCMFYKAKNTFFRSIIGTDNESDNRYLAMEAVFNDLRQLDTKYRCERVDNALFNGESSPSKHEVFTILNKKLSELQNRSLSNRLADGVWYYNKLIDLVKDTLKKSTKGDTFFSEMLPNNLAVHPKELIFTYNVYKTKSDFETDLKNDLVYAKITRDITNPFVPDFLTFIRRKIQLRPIPEEKNRFEYFFDSSSLMGDYITIGDWIIINKELWRIETKSDRVLTLEAYDKKITTESLFTESPNIYNECVYYKNLDPSYYYMYMLGVYLYHFFFVKIGSVTKDKPMMISIAQTATYMNSNPDNIKIKKKWLRLKSKYSLESIYEYLMVMYLRLIFPENKYSYFNQSANIEQKILLLQQDVQKLQAMIAGFIKEIPTRLNEIIPEFDEEKKQFLDIKINKCPIEKIDFNFLIDSFMKVKIERRSNNLQRWMNKIKKTIAEYINLRIKTKYKWINILVEWGAQPRNKRIIKLVSYFIGISILILIGWFVLFHSKSTNSNSENKKAPTTQTYPESEKQSDDAKK